MGRGRTALIGDGGRAQVHAQVAVNPARDGVRRAVKGLAQVVDDHAGGGLADDNG